MVNTKIRDYFVFANYSTIKYLSLIMLGFSIFFLISDYFYPQFVDTYFLSLYRVMDIILLGISIFTIVLYWLLEIRQTRIIPTTNFLLSILILQWAAILTGIEFKIFGLSTYIIILLTTAFYLYFNLIQAIIIFLGSSITLLLTIYLRNELNKDFLPLLFMLIPTSVFCIMMNIRNYRNKIRDFNNQEKILDMNHHLKSINDNLEKEVRNRTMEIQTALEKTQESDRLKSAFLDNMSHEIRTPLNALSGFTELLIRPNIGTEKSKQYARLIDISCKKIIQIIDDVIEVAEIQTNQVKMYFSEFKINTLVDTIIHKFQSKAIEKNVHIKVLSKIDSDAIIVSDYKKIEVVINHLIDNALKFTPKGEIWIRYSLESEEFLFSVTDSGIGINEDLQKVIFEPFRQGEIGTCRSYGGNGLGLAVVKAYVEMLKGTIDLKSEPDIGSTFNFKIPVMIR